MKKKISFSIRTYVLLWSAVFSTVLALLVAGCSYVMTQRYLRLTSRQAAAGSTQLLGSEIGADLDHVKMFARWICLDKTVSDCLGGSGGSRPELVSVWDHLNAELNAQPVRSLIRRVIVSVPDGSRFLQLIPVYDTVNVKNAPSVLMKAPYFDELLTADDFTWAGLQESVLSPYYRKKIIPMIRPIQSSTSTQVVGWVYLEISQDLISRRLDNFTLKEDESIYLVISNHGYRYADGKFTDAVVPEDAVAYDLPGQDWQVALLPSRLELRGRSRFYLLIISAVFLAILAAGLFMGHILRQVINRPVTSLIDKLGRIGQGDFSADPSIEWDNELGEIGRGINRLSENVSALMEKKVQDEKARQELEYRVLQSQINPHFMYNTLNTIKWMATIQGADGIADMSTALSRLLKNVSKGSEALIPVEEELRLLDDYFTIMKYRYGGTIHLEKEIADPALLSCIINRFCLQPIVENAIFHGIEPKGGTGTILVQLHREGDDLLLDVTDDGVGMQPETIRRVLEGSEPGPADFFRQLGIGNVDQRIRQTFGEDYGITIESEPGSYTRMRLRFPVCPR
ncbi:MAG: histidine kinase [Blautia sp.]|nr:histidine kinase [Blautia sp.]